MSRNKNSILAVAVIGALYATGAAAQANLTTGGGTPVRYASEIIKGTNGVVLAESTNIDNRLAFSLGYNFSDQEVRYARLECSNNIRFLSPEVDAGSSTDAVYGSLNGINTNAVFFSITDALAAGAQATANDVVIIGASDAANAYRLLDNNDVVCTYSLYDQPSQAQAGGASGRIFTTTNTFIRSVPSYSFTTTPGSATANVEAANGAYTSFTDPATTIDREIGAFSIGFVPANAANGSLIANGAFVTPADLFAATTGVHVAGDLAAFSNVFHSANVSCGGGNVFNTFSNTAAFENTGVAAPLANVPVCFSELGNVQIPEGTYTATFDVTSANANVYATPDIGPLTLGQIIRNGTSLQAPLVQTPNGYISRIVVTNTSATARTATWNFRPASGATASEANTTYTGPTTGTLTIPANGSIVVNLVDVLGTAATNFGGTPPRGYFTVNAAAPNNQIQGLYQIVNPAAGSISNYVMVRPGTN
jgi:hypothetical protein